MIPKLKIILSCSVGILYFVFVGKAKRKKKPCSLHFRGRCYTYNVTPEINVGEFLIDVLDGGLHALIGEEGRPLLWVCTGL